jgi:hypothetical protein
MQETAANPLSAIAEAVPARAAILTSIAARLAGAALAAYIAYDETYDPTQVFASALAIAMLLSAAAELTATRIWSATGGAGVLFFSGTMLTSVDGGVAILALGALAGAAALTAAYHERYAMLWPLAAFFIGGAATAAGVVLIILTVEG